MSECKFLKGSRAGAGVTFFGTGAGIKKVTLITSGPYRRDHRHKSSGVTDRGLRWATATLKIASLPLSLFAENNSGATLPLLNKNSSELSLPLLLVNF